MGFKSITRVLLVALLSTLFTGISLSPTYAAYSVGSVTSSPFSNTGGGGLGSANCSSSGALVGITSSTTTFEGATMTYLYGGCSPLASDGLSITSISSTALGPYGASGTSATTDNCSSANGNRVVVGAKLYKTTGVNKYASGVQLLCGTLPTGGNRSYSSTTIGTVTVHVQEIACNTGSVAIGLYVYYGGILDRFGINCAPIQNATQSISISSLGTTSKTYPYSQALNISTSGSSGSGSTSYAIAAGGTAADCAISNSASPTATISATSSGTCLVTTTIASDLNYASATSNTSTFTFNRANQTLSFGTTSYSKRYNETQTVSATGTGTGAVTYSVGASTACSIDTNTGVVTITASSGTCTITATIAQDVNYASSNSSNSVTFTVSTASSSASIALVVGNLYFRTTKTLSATPSVAGKLTFRANNVIIPGCKNLTVLANTAKNCSYRPNTRGYVTISVSLVPTNIGYSSASANTDKLFVFQRSGNRS